MTEQREVRLRVRASNSDRTVSVAVPGSISAADLLTRVEGELGLLASRPKRLLNETAGVVYDPSARLDSYALRESDDFVVLVEREEAPRGGQMHIASRSAPSPESNQARIVVGARRTLPNRAEEAVSASPSMEVRTRVRIPTRPQPDARPLEEPVSPRPPVTMPAAPHRPSTDNETDSLTRSATPTEAEQVDQPRVEIAAPVEEKAATVSQIPDEERFRRLTAMGWRVDLLRNAAVLVAGVGALGNEALKNLALAGVGTLVLVDMDSIEGHNLTRTALFRPGDVGRQKARVGAERVSEIDLAINAIPVVGPLQSHIGLGVYRRMNVVLGCLDNIQARRDVNAACMRVGVPFLDAGLDRLRGDVRTFFPPFDVCFDCSVTEDERKYGTTRWQCLQFLEDMDQPIGPTAPTISSMVAGLQAQIALKQIHHEVWEAEGLRFKIPKGRRIVFNGFIDDYDSWDIDPDRECPTHKRVSPIGVPITELPLRSRDATARDLLKAASELLGPGAYIDLAFSGFTLVTALVCPKCGAAEDLLRRRGWIRFREAICFICTPIPEACPGCGYSIDKIFKEFPGLVSVDGITCPECRQVTPVILRDQETFSVARIEPDGKILDRTLAELTIAPLDILQAALFVDDSSGGHVEYRYLELTGDAEEFFGAGHAPRPKT